MNDLHAIARDAATQALKDSDAPIGRADELVAAVTGDALRAVVVARVGQIVRHGYDGEADGMMPLPWLPKRALAFAQQAYDAIGLTAQERDLDLAEKRLAQTAALCMAAIDRIRMAQVRREVG